MDLTPASACSRSAADFVAAIIAAAAAVTAPTMPTNAGVTSPAAEDTPVRLAES